MLCYVILIEKRDCGWDNVSASEVTAPYLGREDQNVFGAVDGKCDGNHHHVIFICKYIFAGFGFYNKI